ncbi:cytidylyltransferase domain-containing protein [Christiangramia aquimixticola]|uniref:acylneuraminate cytidylyltransferase family protein n=1 Tax=Christiangramia aquimixticola TaxID=1697558 RepID=UPI003AA8CF83
MLVVIPARGGSKGVPGKNIKRLNGIPLINYTIKAAREVFLDEQIIVSTDSLEIKATVEETGLNVPFLRPRGLASDTSGTHEVLLHALNYAEANGKYPEVVILLQPTSPFRTDRHIREALELYDSSLDMIVSVKETDANPYYVLREENAKGYLEKSKDGNFLRRQDCPKVWELNGAIYIINTKSLKQKKLGELKKVKKYVMDRESSLDIDTMLDWELAKIMVNSQIF